MIPAHIEKMVGKQYGYLLVIGCAGHKTRKDGSKIHLASYKCVCGKIGATEPCSIRRGGTRSCGCMRQKLTTRKEPQRLGPMPTKEEVEKFVHYDHETGVFTKKGRRRKAAGECDSAISKPSGYARLSIGGRRFLAHRIAYLYMTGRHPDEEIDHINGIRDDNRWANLRSVSSAENKRNTKLRRGNASGCHGVCFDKATDKWIVTIGSKWLGRYKNKDTAVYVRRRAEKRLGYHENHGRTA